MKTRYRMLLLMSFLAIANPTPTARAQREAERWESAIQAFERQDAEAPPAPNGILFVGSSTIRMWNLPQTLPDHEILQRGFGGSQMSDVLHYMDRIVLPYRPRLVVLYEGDNDIASGEDPAQVADEFRRFVMRLGEVLPETRVVYLSIKPSLKRWALYPQMKQANRAIADFCQQQDRCHFVDVSQVMLDAQGQPIKELFVEDGLHLSEAGYRRWSELVRPLLGP